MGPAQGPGACERQRRDSRVPGQGSWCYVYHMTFQLLDFPGIFKKLSLLVEMSPLLLCLLSGRLCVLPCWLTCASFINIK